MRKQVLTLLCALIMTMGVASTALAAEQNNLLGVINVQYVLNNYPGIKEITQQLIDEKKSLQQKYDAESQNLSAEEKTTLSNNLGQEYAKFEKSTMGPVEEKIQKTIAKVAKDNGIQNVVNSNAMVFGGKDITQDVVKELNK